MKLSKKQAWTIVRNAFPTYTGRKFKLEFTTSPYISDTNWAGGTRNQYVLVKLGSDFECQAFPTFSPWANPIEGERFPMRPGFALIEHSIFCGKDCGIRIYAHPADETKALLAA
jgi:hypothetical protein